MKGLKLSPCLNPQQCLTKSPALDIGRYPRRRVAYASIAREGSGKDGDDRGKDWNKSPLSLDGRRRVSQEEIDNGMEASIMWDSGRSYSHGPYSSSEPPYVSSGHSYSSQASVEEIVGFDDPSNFGFPPFPPPRPHFRYPSASAAAQEAAALESAANIFASSSNSSTAASGIPSNGRGVVNVSGAATPTGMGVTAEDVTPKATPDPLCYNPGGLSLLCQTLPSASSTASLRGDPLDQSNSLLPASPPGTSTPEATEPAAAEPASVAAASIPPSRASPPVSVHVAWSWEEWILGLGIGAAVVGFAVTALSKPAGHGGSMLARTSSTNSSSSSSSSSSPGPAVMVLGESAATSSPGSTPFYLREAKPGVMELTAATLPQVLRLRPAFVMFYAPWCPYCQRMEGAWAALAQKLHEENFNVQVARVDAYKYPELTDKYKIPGFPTLVLFNGEQPVGTHRGRRSLDALFSFVERHF